MSGAETTDADASPTNEPSKHVDSKKKLLLSKNENEDPKEEERLDSIRGSNKVRKLPGLSPVVNSGIACVKPSVTEEIQLINISTNSGKTSLSQENKIPEKTGIPEVNKSATSEKTGSDQVNKGQNSVNPSTISEKVSFPDEENKDKASVKSGSIQVNPCTKSKGTSFTEVDKVKNPDKASSFTGLNTSTISDEASLAELDEPDKTNSSAGDNPSTTSEKTRLAEILQSSVRKRPSSNTDDQNNAEHQLIAGRYIF